MRRYVILTHDHPHPHWDLMLETETGLRTWRLASSPSKGAAILAEPLAAHRAAYLDYEGPVSGGRGTVTRWDAGTFDWERDGANEIAVTVLGERFRGRLVLSEDENGNWRCHCDAGDQG